MRVRAAIGLSHPFLNACTLFLAIYSQHGRALAMLRHLRSILDDQGWLQINILNTKNTITHDHRRDQLATLRTLVAQMIVEVSGVILWVGGSGSRPGLTVRCCA